MSVGNSWKTRNQRSYLTQPRPVKERVVKHTPQFTFEQLYISPFTQRKRYDEDGRWQYVPMERKTSPTGILVMDQYVRFLAAGNMDLQPFLESTGLELGEINALVFILTGIKNVRFRQLYQRQLADDLLRYTDMPIDEVARRAGLGSPNNFYLTLRREWNMSATERRSRIRQEGDLGRFKI